MATQVSAVLAEKGHQVITVAPQQSVGSFVELLAKNRIGAAPVIDEQGQMVGIISERDVVRGIWQHAISVLTLPVERLMTHEVLTCSPEDPLLDIMQVMTLRRIRHLPVVRHGLLDGIISIGDVMKRRLEEAQVELEALRNYICSS